MSEQQAKSFTESLFTEQELGGGMVLITHSLTGDTFVCGGATGVSRESGTYWKRNYHLPLVGSIRTQMLPTFGCQMDIRKISIEDVRKIRLVSHIPQEEYEAVVANLYGRAIPYAKHHDKLATGRSALIARYAGPRLDPGERELPDGGRMEFFIIRVMMEHPNPDVQMDYADSAAEFQ